MTTIREDGSRRKLYPADARGRFTVARKWSAVGLIAIYALLPWIRIGGYPAVFLDLADRRFHLFGITLAAQDLWLLFFLITGLGFLLFLVTALVGRIWCGWACPHTVFLEHVYRRIERWVQGDSIERQQLAAAPMSFGKASRIAVTQTGFVFASLAITHLFLAYFVSIPALWSMMRRAPAENWPTFVFVAVATGVVYFNFAWFREQLCIIICPYGRLQSALADEHTLTIGYDSQRGEPRGPAHRPDCGACIGCDRCVRVCPTGIDIRQGLQIECIGCAACIDACDEVMTKVNRPKGLIRYDSLAGLARKPRRFWRPRIAVYAVMLVFGMAAAAWSILGIRPMLVGVTRMVGAPYYMDATAVRNQFLVRVTNKQAHPVAVTLVVSGLPAGATASGAGSPFEMAAMGEEVRPLVVEEGIGDFRGAFRFEVLARNGQGAEVRAAPVEFLGPDTNRPKP